MWERITVALAELGPAALAVSEEQRGEEPVEPTSEEDLVQYEGMLISVAAAQRRRCVTSARPLAYRSLKVIARNFVPRSGNMGCSAVHGAVMGSQYRLCCLQR